MWVLIVEKEVHDLRFYISIIVYTSFAVRPYFRRFVNYASRGTLPGN